MLFPYQILPQCDFHYITPLQHIPQPLFSLHILLAIQLSPLPSSTFLPSHPSWHPHSYLILSMAASNLGIYTLQATHTTTPLLLAHLTSYPIVAITFIHILTWSPLLTPILCLYLILSMVASDLGIYTLQVTHTMTPLLLACLTSYLTVAIAFIHILTWPPLLTPIPCLYLFLSMAASNLGIYALQATRTMTPLLLAHLTSHPIVTIAFIHIFTSSSLLAPHSHSYLILSMVASNPSMNVTAVVITFVTAVTSALEMSVLSAAQLLSSWTLLLPSLCDKSRATGESDVIKKVSISFNLDKVSLYSEYSCIFPCCS